MKKQYVFIFSKTAFERTPYEEWLLGTDVEPIYFLAEEISSTYPQNRESYGFKNYDSNDSMILKALEISQKKRPLALFSRAEVDIVRLAQLREQIGLNGQNYTSALAFRNKIIMKEHLINSEVKLPKFEPVTSEPQMRRFVNAFGFPVVIKPTMESGSTGTNVIYNEGDLNNYLAAPSPSQMEIETFVDGPMFHIDGLWIDGQIEFIIASKYLGNCLMFRKNESLGSLTLNPESNESKRLIEATKKVLSSLPTPKNMAFHCEIWIQPDGQIVFCEIASRTGGGLIGPMIEQSTGINLDREWLRAEVGFYQKTKSEALKLAYRPSGMILFQPEVGVLKKMDCSGIPSYIEKKVFGGQVGKRYYGGIKSGLFLAAFVITGVSQESVINNINETKDWFQKIVEWEL